ncbi:RNA polymerase sigma factor [Bacteroidota bacterium]
MVGKNVSDHDLVKGFMAGDSSCMEYLILRHKDKVYSYILLLVKDSHLAEDVFQDTFVKVINSLKAGKYYDNGKFLSWVVRIAHNLIIDHFRKEKQLQFNSSDNSGRELSNTSIHAEGTIEEQIIHDQIHNDVRKLIDLLPDDQKKVVLLRHYGGLSFKEIADQTNVSINTALGRMRYALINLRKLMKDHNISLNII